MRNWTMAILPLAFAMTATGCSGADKDAARQDGGRDGPPAHVGPIATQDYALTGFTGVEVTGPDDVTIRRGDAFSISARGRQDALDRLEIKRDGDRLSIGRKTSGWNFRDHDDVDIAITMPRLGAVKLTGSGSIKADSADGDMVEAAVTGSGELKIAKLTAKRVELTMSGSGDLDVEGGTAESAEIRITGSGDVDADGMVAQTLDVSMTGSGDVEANATGKADVSLLGSGDVTIAGGATCSTSKTGSGSVNCK